jgi:hypothetical protein
MQIRRQARVDRLVIMVLENWVGEAHATNDSTENCPYEQLSSEKMLCVRSLALP